MCTANSYELLPTMKLNCYFGVFSYNGTGAKCDRFNDKTDCLPKQGKLSNGSKCYRLPFKHVKYQMNNMIKPDA